MRGRKPIPTRLKIALGNPGRTPINRDEPQPERGIPATPPDMGDAELALWHTMTTMLDQLGVLTVADGGSLERYCQGVIEWRTDRDAKSRRALEPMLLNIEREFGLTPSSRARLHVINGQPKDALDEFLKAKKHG